MASATTKGLLLCEIRICPFIPASHYFMAQLSSELKVIEPHYFSLCSMFTSLPSFQMFESTNRASLPLPSKKNRVRMQ